MSADDDPPHAAIAPPPAFLSAPASASVLAALPGARAVGGCVRDALADRPVHDVDVAAPMPPDAVAPLLRRAGMKVFETGLAHGTVTAVLGGQPVEVTSLRRDVATDGRHAAVEWTTDWREDAARRDLTMNAMSLAADGRLWDYFGGREDLAAGRVRFVGDPDTRLREDYLRALRFFRFQARYGRGEPDPAALAAIRAAVPGLGRLSAERVWMEIKRLLAAPDPSGAVELMAETGVLGVVLPEAVHLGRLSLAVQDGLPNDPLVRLAVILGDQTDIAQLAARLRLSSAEAARLKSLRQIWPVSTVASPFRLRGELADLDGTEFVTRAWLTSFARTANGSTPNAPSAPVSVSVPEAVFEAVASFTTGNPSVSNSASAENGWPEIHEALRGKTPLPFPVRGRDALALGLPPGSEIGQLLGEVKAWWQAGGCLADREACLEQLRELAAARGI